MHCPKCHGPMHTYTRSGIQIEQCANCRGIFLDFGELEALTQMEAQWSKPAAPSPYGHQPQPHAPAWGAPHHGQSHQSHHGHHGHHGHESFIHMLFSS